MKSTNTILNLFTNAYAAHNGKEQGADPIGKINDDQHTAMNIEHNYFNITEFVLGRHGNRMTAAATQLFMYDFNNFLTDINDESGDCGYMRAYVSELLNMHWDKTTIKAKFLDYLEGTHENRFDVALLLDDTSTVEFKKMTVCEINANFDCIIYILIPLSIEPFITTVYRFDGITQPMMGSVENRLLDLFVRLIQHGLFKLHNDYSLEIGISRTGEMALSSKDAKGLFFTVFFKSYMTENEWGDLYE